MWCCLLHLSKWAELSVSWQEANTSTASLRDQLLLAPPPGCVVGKELLGWGTWEVHCMCIYICVDIFVDTLQVQEIHVTVLEHTQDPKDPQDLTQQFHKPNHVTVVVFSVVFEYIIRSNRRPFFNILFNKSVKLLLNTFK